MIVVFTSECKDKALKRTKQILDSFSLRIGRRTWKTLITEDGLLTIKKLLRKNASKNTSVSCYRVSGYNEMNLLWAVGNKDHFNDEGVYPVNYTNKSNESINNWKYLDLIKSLVAMASLFHDFVKASVFFQEKLKRFEICGDPMRHDWLSAILFVSFTKNYKNNEWIDLLFNDDFVELEKKMILSFQDANKVKILDDISDLVLSISWLIMTHHKLPVYDNVNKAAPLTEFKDFLKIVSVEWGYRNKKDGDNSYDENLQKCFEFSNGLPISDVWIKHVKRYANKLKSCFPLFEECIKKGCLRSILSYSRLCIVLGDHTFSSKDNDKDWKGKSNLFANSYKDKKELKQKLDEHLIGVTNSSVNVAHFLPSFDGMGDELPYAHDVKFLSLKSPKKFQWQDIIVEKVREWRKDKNNYGVSQFGFFGVNIASTGKGKTIANAKLMQALSTNGDTLRYIYSIGLRTLTFQTGNEYKEKLKLSDEELAVVIGGTLVNMGKEDLKLEESLFDNDIMYDESFISKDHLSTLLINSKNKAFLYAPVLCCTIDHIIQAVENTRGGKNILPFLRLMSSDLVIDEIDDFTDSDLIPVGRLIYLAGMLGRKVIISSATITPDIVEGYYSTYKHGWSQFAKFKEVSNHVACAFMDEFTTEIHNS
jgi:CRISPR-associated endonuclease/helicase Cas3